TLTAAPDARFDLTTLRVVGQGQGPGGPIEGVASKQLVFAQQGNLPTNTLHQEGLPAASALPLPIALDAPATPVEVPHGHRADARVNARRSEGADPALAFALLNPPAGITVAGNVPEKAAEGKATVNAAVEAALGPANLVLTAKGKVGDKELILVAPMITI